MPKGSDPLRTMSDIIRLHHEDWDFNKLFGDLKSQGVKAARLQLPREWEEDEKLRMEKTTELLSASEKAGVNILELVPHHRDSSSPTAPQNDGLKNKFGPAPVITNGHLKLYLIIGCILAAMVVGGGIVLSQRAFKQQEEQLVSPAAVIPTPTPRPEADQPLAEILNRSDLTIRVLNGSGKRGAAGELAKFLEGLEYSVSLTGNTNVQTGSKLRLKSGSEIYREILAADLESKLEPASGSALSEKDIVGGEIIIGTD